MGTDACLDCGKRFWYPDKPDVDFLDGLNEIKESRPIYEYYCRKCLRYQTMEAKYGLPRYRYERMLWQQNNACKICKQKFTETPHIDHDHNTDEVRGLLCRGCNLGLGQYIDDPDRLIAAAEYLRAQAPAPQAPIKDAA